MSEMKKLTTEASQLVGEIIRAMDNELSRNRIDSVKIANLISCIKGDRQCDQSIAGALLFAKLLLIGSKIVPPEEINEIFEYEDAGLVQFLREKIKNILAFKSFARRWRDLEIEGKIFEKGKEEELS